MTDCNRLLSDWRAGDRDAGNKLFAVLGTELRAIAAAKLRHEHKSSLSTGDLVNESVVKLLRLNDMALDSQAHVLALLSRLMRQILIDEARKRGRAKRDHTPVTLTTLIAQEAVPVDVIMLNDALEELKEIDEQRAQIVEMRFFGGMTNADIATVIGVSEPTVKRRWVATRAWLQDRLGRG